MRIIRYALSSISRNCIRYGIFGTAMILLFGLSCVNLVLGSCAVEICDVLKEEYGTAMRVIVTEKQSIVTKLSLFDDFNHPDLVKAVEKRTAVHKLGGNETNADQSIMHQNIYRWLVGINLEYPHLFSRKNNPPELIEGRLFAAENECCITDDYFARLKESGLINQVGDTLYIQNSFAPKDENYEFVTGTGLLGFIVTGIVKMDSLDIRYQNSTDNPKDVVFVPFETASCFLDDADSIMKLYDTRFYRPESELTNGYELIFRLHDYRDIDQFEKFVQDTDYSYYVEERENRINGVKTEIVKSNYGFVAEPLMPEFEQILTPLEQLQTFTGITTVTVAVLAVAVVALMSVINMRERKYELGVLRCVGMSKGRISLTLGIESVAFLLITAALGITLGFGFAALFGDAFVDLTIVDTTIDTMAISGEVALRLVIAALGLSVFATVISAAFVMRARPLAILRNRT